MLTGGGSTSTWTTVTAYGGIYLSEYFTIQFDVIGVSIYGYPSTCNVLQINDASSSANLLSVSLPWTTNTMIGYNGAQIEAWGPTLVPNYQSTYTTFTVSVTAGAVSVSSSSSAWVDTISVAANVNTTSRMYYLYLTNPNVGNAAWCAQGSIKNVIITGKLIIRCSML